MIQFYRGIFFRQLPVTFRLQYTGSSYFREFGISGYEGSAGSIALNRWSHIRAEITGDQGLFYVDGQKVLEVSGLKHGPDSKGAVGLYVDIGTDGYFRNLKIDCTD